MMDNVRFNIAIIVPVYNAEKYLRECLDSICKQTYKDWECLLINDGSTDSSQQIIDEYCKKDCRFRGYEKENEKSASLARRYGIEHTNADWIIAIDADDAISDTFVAGLVARQMETGADSVSWRMIRCKQNLDGESWSLPERTFDMDMVIHGREACLMTLGGWQIPGVGMIRRELLLNNSPGPYMNSDEFEQRLILLNVKTKAFSDVIYYYRANTATSYGVSIRMFDRTLVDIQLEQFVYDNFPEREDKIKALAWQRLFNLIYLTADYQIHKQEFSKEEQEKAYAILRKSFKALNRKTAKTVAPLHTLMLTHSFYWFSILATSYVKYKRNHGGTFYYR